jgi:hypothetical protein
MEEEGISYPVDLGDGVEQIGERKYLALSSDGVTKYPVELYSGEWRCGCKGFANYGGCRHIREIRGKREKRQEEFLREKLAKSGIKSLEDLFSGAA